LTIFGALSWWLPSCGPLWSVLKILSSLTILVSRWMNTGNRERGGARPQPLGLGRQLADGAEPDIGRGMKPAVNGSFGYFQGCLLHGKNDCTTEWLKLNWNNDHSDSIDFRRCKQNKPSTYTQKTVILTTSRVTTRADKLRSVWRPPGPHSARHTYHICSERKNR
jgi:hypothetical protein